MPVTLHDIAVKLGISVSTVSRVLNGSILISDEQTHRILKTAEELGYRKRLTRRHRARAILNIALFLPYREDSDLNMFTAISALIVGMKEGLEDVRANFIVSINQSDTDFFGNKKLGDIDGVVFAFTQPEEDLILALDDRNIPSVVLNRVLEDRNYIVANNEEGMKLLLQKIVRKRPSARPCYLGFASVPQVSDSRFRGLAEGCRALRIPFGSGDRYEIDSFHDVTTELLQRILDNGHDAILCFNDSIAILVYQTAMELGLKIPDAFSLTGFDNSPAQALITRRIDTINLSSRVFGREAACWLRKTVIEREPQRLRLLVEGEYLPGSTI